MLYILAIFARYFIVAASDIDPEKTSYAGNIHFDRRGEYRRCGQFIGVPPYTPTPMFCQPGAIGRYTYLYQTIRTKLLFCELEVYGTGKCVHEYVLATGKLQLDIKIYNSTVTHFVTCHWELISLVLQSK